MSDSVEAPPELRHQMTGTYQFHEEGFTGKGESHRQGNRRQYWTLRMSKITHDSWATTNSEDGTEVRVLTCMMGAKAK